MTWMPWGAKPAGSFGSANVLYRIPSLVGDARIILDGVAPQILEAEQLADNELQPEGPFCRPSQELFWIATPPIASDSAQLASLSTRFTVEGVVESPIL
jgi:hypothetical protein